MPGVQPGLDNNVVEQHVLNRPFLADEETHAAVRVPDHQVLEDTVADGVHTVAEPDAGRPRRQRAIGDRDILADAGPSAVDTGDADRIIAAEQLAVGDVYVPARLEVDAVVVRDDRVVEHLNAVDAPPGKLGVRIDKPDDIAAAGVPENIEHDAPVAAAPQDQALAFATPSVK